jgi:hypothetical protein
MLKTHSTPIFAPLVNTKTPLYPLFINALQKAMKKVLKNQGAKSSAKIMA